MTISELEKRIDAVLNAEGPSHVKSAKSLSLTDLETAYRYALARLAERESGNPNAASETDIATSLGVNKSTLNRCLTAFKLLYPNDDAWQAALLRDFPELRRIAVQLLSGGVPPPSQFVLACPPSVATSFMPKVLRAIWSAGGFPKEFERVRLEVRQTHDNERDIREMAAGSVHMKVVESYAVDPVSLEAVGVAAERLFDSMPLGLIYPRANKVAATVFAAATYGRPPDWAALGGQTFLLTHSYRIADALAELLPPPSEGGGRAYMTTLNNVRACIIDEGMNAIGIGVDPRKPDTFGHFSFSSLPDGRSYTFLKGNAVVSYAVLYSGDKPASKSETTTPKKGRRVRADPLGDARALLLRAMRTAATGYTHPFVS